MKKFPRSKEKSGGWILDFWELEKIRDETPYDDECGELSLEAVESVICTLARHGYMEIED